MKYQYRTVCATLMRSYVMFHSIKPLSFTQDLLIQWQMLISCACYYSEQHSISIVSIRENSVSLYASSPYLTMGSECRRDMTAENSLSKEFIAPLVQEGAPVFVHHCAPENWERAPGSRLWSACAEALSGDQTIHCWPVVNWDFSEASNEARLGQVGVFPPLGIQAASTYYIFAKSQFSDHN